jgi:hypothetical protein
LADHRHTACDPHDLNVMNTTRFVILHHRQRSGEHWDLMIEQPDALATWQLADDPTRTEAPRAITATRIGDHRKAYLTYEGPVSQDRGEVRRIEQGACELLCADDSTWLLHLQGNHLQGQYALRQVQANQWTFTPSKPNQRQ